MKLRRICDSLPSSVTSGGRSPGSSITSATASRWARSRRNMPRRPPNRSATVNDVGPDDAPAGLDAGQVEQVVHHLRQRQRGASRTKRTWRSCSSVERAVDPIHQQPGDVEDGVERRPELVADVGQEPGLELRGAGQVGRLLVQLGVERQHAAVGLRQLLVQPLDLHLPLAHLLAGPAAAPGSAPGSRRRGPAARAAPARGSAARPSRAVTARGLARQDLAEHDGGAASRPSSISNRSHQPAGAEHARAPCRSTSDSARRARRSAGRCPGPGRAP